MKTTNSLRRTPSPYATYLSTFDADSEDGLPQKPYGLTLDDRVAMEKLYGYRQKFQNILVPSVLYNGDRGISDKLFDFHSGADSVKTTLGIMFFCLIVKLP